MASRQKDGKLRVFLIRAAGRGQRFLARVEAYTAKAARHEGKRRFPDFEIVVQEAK